MNTTKPKPVRIYYANKYGAEVTLDYLLSGAGQYVQVSFASSIDAETLFNALPKFCKAKLSAHHDGTLKAAVFDVNMTHARIGKSTGHANEAWQKRVRALWKALQEAK